MNRENITYGPSCLHQIPCHCGLENSKTEIRKLQSKVKKLQSDLARAEKALKEIIELKFGRLEIIIARKYFSDKEKEGTNGFSSL